MSQVSPLILKTRGETRRIGCNLFHLQILLIVDCRSKFVRRVRSERTSPNLPTTNHSKNSTTSINKLKKMRDYSIVGWVEVTKPFGYAVPERSRRAGQRPTNQKIRFGLTDSETQPTITGRIN